MVKKKKRASSNGIIGIYFIFVVTATWLHPVSALRNYSFLAGCVGILCYVWDQIPVGHMQGKDHHLCSTSLASWNDFNKVIYCLDRNNSFHFLHEKEFRKLRLAALYSGEPDFISHFACSWIELTGKLRDNAKASMLSRKQTMKIC